MILFDGLKRRYILLLLGFYLSFKAM